jgi:hypothetical protein
MERAERSEGLHKRSAEDWGRGLSGARGEAPLRGFGCCFSGAALRAGTRRVEVGGAETFVDTGRHISTKPHLDERIGGVAPSEASIMTANQLRR